MKSHARRSHRQAHHTVSGTPCVSMIALAISLSFPAAAHAAEYFVSNEAQLRAAITTASTNGDTNAVIKMAASFTMTDTTAFPTSTVPVTIDTNGFVLTRAGLPAAASMPVNLPSQYTFNGDYVGQAGAIVAGHGLFLAGSDVENTAIVNGNVTGGARTTTGGGGGVGINLGTGDLTLINNGVVTGGQANNLTNGNTQQSAGLSVGNTTASTILNNGTIEGGAGVGGGFAGAGVAFGNVLSGTSLVNTNMIRGGTGTGGGTGNAGVRVTAGTLSIENRGTIEGGNGATAIFAQATTTLTLINSGNIIAGADIGAGRPNAVTMGAGGALNLELRAGSYIDGNVVASSSATDTLRLGGSANSVFDTSLIGTQYLAFERFVKTGSSTWTLSDTSGSNGPWTIEDGTLALDTTLNTSLMTIAAAGTLGGNGTVVGNVTGAGTVAPGSLGTLTIDGNYASTNGTIRINTELAGDSSATGRLVVTGDTSGTGRIQVTNVGGAGAQTSQGIKVVDVQGASNATYTLLGNYTFEGDPAVIAGAYAYRLYKNGIATPGDGDWYLRSMLIAPSGGTTPLLAPTVPLYETYASVLQKLNQLGTFQQRIGNRAWSGDRTLDNAPGKPIVGRGAWAHIDGENTHVDPSASTADANYKVKTWKLEAGIDMPVFENDAGTLVAGPTVHYGTADASVSSRFGDGSLDVDGYGIGGALTWYGNNGFYVDGQLALSWYDTDIWSSTLGSRLQDGNDGRGLAASVEAGQRLPLGGNWTITPQAQLTWSKVRFDSFTDQYGTDVSRDNGSSLVARLGISLDRESKWTIGGKERRARVYGITNLYYDFLNGTSAHVADLDVESKEQALWAGIGGGAFLNWDDGRYMLYGELLARTSLQALGDSHSIGAKVGVRMRW